MLTFPPKDPDETLDYKVDWSATLGGQGDEDTIAASTFVLETAAGAAIASQSFGASYSAVWISGGTDGQVARLVNTITTAAGRTFEKTIALPIAASTPATPTAAYSDPTAADLIARFPAFQCVSVAAITAALGEAARQVDSTWIEGDFIAARLLYAAHVLTMDGHGTGAEAQAAAAGALGFKTMKSGGLTLERFDNAKGSSGMEAELSTTSYGRRFLRMLKLNHGGPIVLSGDSATAHARALDWT